MCGNKINEIDGAFFFVIPPQPVKIILDKNKFDYWYGILLYLLNDKSFSCYLQTSPEDSQFS